MDLFYQHRVDPNVPIEDVAGAVKDLIQESKLSLPSFRSGRANDPSCTPFSPVRALQSEYSLCWRNPEAEVLPTLEEPAQVYVAKGSDDPVHRWPTSYANGRCLTFLSYFGVLYDYLRRKYVIAPGGWLLGPQNRR
jgi:hypothetical protein